MSLGIRHAPLFTFLVGGVTLESHTATHTFSCFQHRIATMKELSLLLSFTLQFRVSTCQRSIWNRYLRISKSGECRGRTDGLPHIMQGLSPDELISQTDASSKEAGGRGSRTL